MLVIIMLLSCTLLSGCYTHYKNGGFLYLADLNKYERLKKEYGDYDFFFIATSTSNTGDYDGNNEPTKSLADEIIKSEKVCGNGYFIPEKGIIRGGLNDSVNVLIVCNKQQKTGDQE